MRVRVHIKPRASRSRVLGVRGESLDVAVAAPPVDGLANAELVMILARKLDLPRRAVNIVSGHTGRSKVVAVTGLSEPQLLERLGAGAEVTILARG